MGLLPQSPDDTAVLPRVEFARDSCAISFLDFIADHRQRGLLPLCLSDAVPHLLFCKVFFGRTHFHPCGTLMP